MYRSIGIELVEPRVIYNAVDPVDLPPRRDASRSTASRPIRLICSSWSDNPRKGAPTYRWLEDHLDWDRFEFTFVGNTPTPFERIRHLPPLPSSELADVLRQHDIFVTATEHDAYSNALVEALSCGLPAVYLDSGGSREAVKEAGFALPRARGDPRAARSARRRVRAAAGADLAAVARGDRRPVPRGRSASTTSWEYVAQRASSAVRRAARPRRRPSSRGGGGRPRGSSSSARGPAGRSTTTLHELARDRRPARRRRRRLAPPLRVQRGQAAFYGSQFTLLREPWRPSPHRLGTAYFHGRPGTPGMPEFDECYRVAQRSARGDLAASRCRTPRCDEIVLSSGIDPGEGLPDPDRREPGLLRAADGGVPAPRRGRRSACPTGAFVVGSFHKDGVGFGDGLEPKAIKGPDVLLEALASCASGSPSCTSSSQGRRAGTSARGSSGSGSPTATASLERYEQIGQLYQALDAYVVPSRQEGGPKGVFEAMASGVPVVTTRVGQAMDLVRHGENAWMVDVDDAEGLAHWLAHVAERPPELPQVIAAGLETAAANTYEAPAPAVAGVLRRVRRGVVSGWRDRVPWSVRGPVRRTRNGIASGVLAVREAPRRRSIAAASPRRDGLAVFYGVDRMPGDDEVVIGGAVKFQLLNERAPERAARLQRALSRLEQHAARRGGARAALARRRGAAFAWNQNGVAYPGWYGGGFELVNRPRARLMHEADHVFFQTAFCKLGADRFYGERERAVGDPQQPGRHRAVRAAARAARTDRSRSSSAAASTSATGSRRRSRRSSSSGASGPTPGCSWPARSRSRPTAPSSARRACGGSGSRTRSSSSARTRRRRPRR